MVDLHNPHSAALSNPLAILIVVVDRGLGGRTTPTKNAEAQKSNTKQNKS